MPTPEMFKVVEPRPQHQSPLDPGQATDFDWDRLLSIDMIRQHTKTDDIPGVTDEQLKFYRRAAIEAAELYTGLLLKGQKTITEPINGPGSVKPWKTTYKHRLRYPVAEDMVYLYGAKYPGANVPVRVKPGTATINIPVHTTYVDTTNCCDPCAKQIPINNGMMVAYRAGFSCPEAVPATIILGMLQFLAWTIEHPGDELLTQRGKQDALGNRGIAGSNNIAMVSGALETWRTYDPEAI